MEFNLIDIFVQFMNLLGGLLSQFTQVRTTLEGVITRLDSFDFISVISPYVGTIRYVAGETIYGFTIRIVQVSLFVGLIKAAYQLVYMITNSVLIKKPMALIKSFIGL